MAARKAMSKRLRFEVFKRDGFRCTYCGATPTDGPLHVDHVAPVAKGGKNDPDNLVTACANCNLGKGATELGDRLPSKISDEAQREQAEQIREYLAVQREIHAARKQVVDVLGDYWAENVGSAPTDLDARFAKLLTEFTPAQLMEAMDIVASRLGSYYGTSVTRYEDRLRYLYGVLRKWREQGVRR